MVGSCAAYGCNNSSINLSVDGKRITFHRFPLNDKYLLKTWLVKIYLENFEPKIHAYAPVTLMKIVFNI